MQSIFEKYDKISYASCYECPPGMRGKKLKLPENPFNPYLYDYSDVLKKYAKYPTFGYPNPESLATTFKRDRDMIQCVPCMAGRYNPKYGYPNSPEWDPNTKKMIDGTDCTGNEFDYKLYKTKDDETVFNCDDVPCLGCGPGQKSSSYALTCTLCAPGRFQDKSISSDCEFCIAGQFAQNNGSFVCKFDDLFFYPFYRLLYLLLLTLDLFILICCFFLKLIYRFNMSSGVV